MMIKKFNEKGVNLVCLDLPYARSEDPATQILMRNIFLSLAEFDLSRRKERQRQGIEKAKLNGVYLGRKSKIQITCSRSRLP
jgi:DNA invertase Pin-like site-specific DNA recombinase